MKLDAGKDFLRCEYCLTLHFPDPNADGVRVLDVDSEFACPRCKIPVLVHGAISGERVHYCIRCRGMLIPMGTFVGLIEELRSRHESSEYAGKQPEWADLDRHLNCPQCHAPMNTHPYAGPGAVIIDSCSTCYWNWLDHGELQRIVRAPDHKFAALIDEDERRKIDAEAEQQGRGAWPFGG